MIRRGDISARASVGLNMITSNSPMKDVFIHGALASLDLLYASKRVYTRLGVNSGFKMRQFLSKSVHKRLQTIQYSTDSKPGN